MRGTAEEDSAGGARADEYEPSEGAAAQWRPSPMELQGKVSMKHRGEDAAAGMRGKEANSAEGANAGWCPLLEKGTGKEVGASQAERLSRHGHSNPQ